MKRMVISSKNQSEREQSNGNGKDETKQGLGRLGLFQANTKRLQLGLQENGLMW
jgi:hypothetical protein